MPPGAPAGSGELRRKRRSHPSTRGAVGLTREELVALLAGLAPSRPGERAHERALGGAAARACSGRVRKGGSTAASPGAVPG